MVDLNALRTNQVIIVGMVALAFLLGAERGVVLLALLALCMAIGVAFPGKGPIQLLYRNMLVPVGLVKPARESGSQAPHRFAQAMGASCLALAAILLLVGFDFAGWVLAFVVLVLALVNLVFGFCTGCFIYLHLGRLRSDARA
jgi:hypothetical protein